MREEKRDVYSRIFYMLIGMVAGLCFVAQAEEASEPINFYLGAETQLYRDIAEPSVFPFARLGGQYHQQTKETETVADLEVRIGLLNPKAFSVASQNLYWGDPDQSYESALRFTYGRRKIHWNELDNLWKLGNIEPLDGWDRMRANPQGLTGIFAFSETQKLNFRFFISGISLPENSPNVSLEGNQFKNIHPQAGTSTPQTISLLNRPTPLGYQIQMPSVARVIFRSSVLFMVETKPEIPFFARFTYGYLPLNYFPLALEASLAIPLNQVVVGLRPRLIEHHIYAGDIGYQLNERFTMGVSAMADEPNSENLSSEYTYTPLTSSFLVSPWLRYIFPHIKLTLSQLWVNSGLGNDVGPYANPDQSLFSSHIFYRNATMFAAHFYPTREDDLGSLKLKYIYEHSIDATWISGDFIIKLAKKNGWTFTIGGDLIQAKESASRFKGAEFLSDMRALDRIRLGVSYAF
jgi:hypothetical protein